MEEHKRGDKTISSGEGRTADARTVDRTFSF